MTNNNKSGSKTILISTIAAFALIGSLFASVKAGKAASALHAEEQSITKDTGTGKETFPEPEVRPAQLREDAYWDAELGMYISGDFIKNENGEYKLKTEAVINGDTTDYNAIWLSQSCNLEDPIDQAILLSIEMNNKEQEQPSYFSSITPQQSTAILQAMKTIPIECYPELWRRCCEEIAFRAQKLTAMEQFLGISLNYGLYDLWAQDHLWAKDFVALKNNVPDHAFTQEDREKYGNLLLPSLRERLFSGSLTEEEWILLRELIEQASSQFEFRKGDLSTEKNAKEWMEDHKSLINAIQDIIESDYCWVNAG